MERASLEELLSTERVTGFLLIASLLLPVVMLLLFAARGDLRDVFSQIEGAARNAFVQRMSLTGWTVAALLALAGFALLTTLLQRDGESGAATVAQTALLFSTVLLVLEATIHLTFGAWAAEEVARTGTEPEMYAVIFQWASVTLQRVYVSVGYVGLVLYGWAILQADLLPPWTGWTTLAWGAGMFILLVLSRTTLPATLLVPGVVIGIALLTTS